MSAAAVLGLIALGAAIALVIAWAVWARGSSKRADAETAKRVQAEARLVEETERKKAEGMTSEEAWRKFEDNYKRGR